MSGQGFNREDPVDGSMKRLAVEDSISAAFRHIHNEFISWEHLDNLLVTTLPDHTKVRVWLSDIRQWRGNGNGEKLPREFSHYGQLKDEILIGLNERINLCDPLTKIACINYESRMWRQFDDVNPKIFLKSILAYNGRLIHISGNPGSGKTDFAMLLADYALKENFIIITNIKTKDAILVRYGEEIRKEGVEYRSGLYKTIRMSDLLYQCIKHRKAGKNVVVIWDEVSTFYNRQEAQRGTNIDMGKFLRLIRKFNANILFLEQIDDNLAGIANAMLVSKFIKETRKRVHYMTLPGEGQYNEYLESVPKASIDFDTGDFAGFVNDVKFGEMFNIIAVEEEEKLDQIEEYLSGIIDRNASKKIIVKNLKRINEETELVRNKKGQIVAHRPINKISHSNNKRKPRKTPRTDHDKNHENTTDKRKV